MLEMTTPHAGGTGIIDTRILSKPRSWDGSKEEWHRWSFQLCNYSQVLSPTLAHWMETAARSPVMINNADLDEPQVQASAQLHSILALLLEGPALDALMAVPSAHGFEAWRRLNADNEPRTIGHRRGILLKLMNPIHLEGTFIQKCQKWEREYLDFRSLGGTELNEEIKMGILHPYCARHRIRGT